MNLKRPIRFYILLLNICTNFRITIMYKIKINKSNLTK